jgi:hypothetical protein
MERQRVSVLVQVSLLRKLLMTVWQPHFPPDPLTYEFGDEVSNTWTSEDTFKQ